MLDGFCGRRRRIALLQVLLLILLTQLVTDVTDLASGACAWSRTWSLAKHTDEAAAVDLAHPVTVTVTFTVAVITCLISLRL